MRMLSCAARRASSSQSSPSLPRTQKLAPECRDARRSGEVGLQGSSHDLPPRPVSAMKAPDEHVVMAEGKEERRRALIVVGGMPDHQTAQRSRLLDQRLRRNQKSETQTRTQT